MTLAARHRGLPVVIGAIAAFAILNLLAVLFGAAVAAWLPEWVVTAGRRRALRLFGISACASRKKRKTRRSRKNRDTAFSRPPFLMIFLAEFGDKTQIAVAGLGSTSRCRSVGWRHAGAGHTSVLGVYRRPPLAEQAAAALDSPHQRRVFPAPGLARRLRLLGVFLWHRKIQAGFRRRP
jgi:putative Ca2+/H+ antiporter (TMEM165/GDT1 family)